MKPDQTHCFLCNPDRALVYAESPAGIAVAGLGPLVEGYSVVASPDHTRSLADLPPSRREAFLSFLERIRDTLSSRWSTCLLTEHGRSPLCDLIFGRSDRHCYHAHCLLFPGAPTIQDELPHTFDRVDSFASMQDALAFASSAPEYFLVSPSSDLFQVCQEPFERSSQLARHLVAAKLSKPELASWKDHPQHSEASRNAAFLRPAFDQDE